MRSSSIVLVTAVIVLLGRWSQGKKVEATIVVGGLFAALMISMLDSAQPKLARGLAWLIFTSAALTYLGPILVNAQKSGG